MQLFTMKMEILLEWTSYKLLVGDMWDPYWIKLVTTGKQQWGDSHLESNLFQEMDWRMLLYKTIQCAHQLIFEHIGCVWIFQNKSIYDGNVIQTTKLSSCHKNVYSRTHEWFLKSISHQSVNFIFTDSLYRAVCFETFRYENMLSMMIPKWILWKIHYYKLEIPVKESLL